MNNSYKAKEPPVETVRDKKAK
jgi:hypothetical protein